MRRSWALAFALLVSAAAVVVGVYLLSAAAAWIVGGLLFAAWSWLLVAEVPEPAGRDS